MSDYDEDLPPGTADDEPAANVHGDVVHQSHDYTQQEHADTGYQMQVYPGDDVQGHQQFGHDVYAAAAPAAASTPSVPPVLTPPPPPPGPDDVAAGGHSAAPDPPIGKRTASMTIPTLKGARLAVGNGGGGLKSALLASRAGAAPGSPRGASRGAAAARSPLRAPFSSDNTRPASPVPPEKRPSLVLYKPDTLTGPAEPTSHIQDMSDRMGRRRPSAAEPPEAEPPRAARRSKRSRSRSASDSPSPRHGAGGRKQAKPSSASTVHRAQPSPASGRFDDSDDSYDDALRPLDLGAPRAAAAAPLQELDRAAAAAGLAAAAALGDVLDDDSDLDDRIDKPLTALTAVGEAPQLAANGGRRAKQPSPPARALLEASPEASDLSDDDDDRGAMASRQRRRFRKAAADARARSPDARARSPEERGRCDERSPSPPPRARRSKDKSKKKKKSRKEAKRQASPSESPSPAGRGSPYERSPRPSPSRGDSPPPRRDRRSPSYRRSRSRSRSPRRWSPSPSPRRSRSRSSPSRADVKGRGTVRGRGATGLRSAVAWDDERGGGAARGRSASPGGAARSRSQSPRAGRRRSPSPTAPRRGRGEPPRESGQWRSRSASPAGRPAAIAQIMKDPAVFATAERSLLESRALMLSQSANMQSGVNAALTKHARRVYVGGLPYGVTEVDIMELFNKALMAAACSLAPGAPVMSTFINQDKRFAFVELRTVAEASNALALDGILCQGAPLSLRRPHDYNPVEAKKLGPSEPDPGLNLQLVTLVMQLLAGANNKVFVENVPAEMPEDEVAAQLSKVSRVVSFALVRDPETRASRGKGLAEFASSAALDGVVAQLNSTVLQGRTLLARRAALAPEADDVLQQLIQRHQKNLIHGPGSAMAASESAAKPCVVRLRNVLEPGDFEDDKEVEAIEHDVQLEVKKYGELEEVLVSRPGEGATGVGDILIKYKDPRSAARAARALQGRLFGDVALQAGLVATCK